LWNLFEKGYSGIFLDSIIKWLDCPGVDPRQSCIFASFGLGLMAL
jgi:hypothetical protein